MEAGPKHAFCDITTESIIAPASQLPRKAVGTLPLIILRPTKNAINTFVFPSLHPWGCGSNFRGIGDTFKDPTLGTMNENAGRNWMSWARNGTSGWSTVGFQMIRSTTNKLLKNSKSEETLCEQHVPWILERELPSNNHARQEGHL